MAGKARLCYAVVVADFLRDMDPAHRAFLAIFIAVMLKSMLAVQWERFKERQAAQPTSMKLRDGVYVPWGPVERINRLISLALKVWLVYLAACLAFLAYVKLVGISGFA